MLVVGRLPGPCGLCGPAAADDRFNPRAHKFSEIWLLPESSRSSAFHIRTEFIVYYCDPDWSCSWGECDGSPCFLPLGRSGPVFHSGQRVFLDGLIVPDEQQVLWEQSHYSILSEVAQPAVTSTRGRIGDGDALQSRWVEVEGLVDSCAAMEGSHTRLNVLVDGINLTVYGKASLSITNFDLEGSFVRLKGVYCVSHGINRNTTRTELWVPDICAAVITGKLSEDSRFDLHLTAS
jgi:hypothetical protein